MTWETDRDGALEVPGADGQRPPQVEEVLEQSELTRTAFDDLLEVWASFKRHEPLTVRFEVRELDTLRRFTGTAAPRTDLLGVADWAGVPVYETAEMRSL